MLTRAGKKKKAEGRAYTLLRNMARGSLNSVPEARSRLPHGYLPFQRQGEMSRGRA
jgi:hypothetical protein